VNCFEAVVIHMGVNLGSSDVGVSEHFLQGPEVGPSGQQMAGKTMAEGMDGQFFGQTGAASVFFDDSP
jgi:hypothetical protein